MLSTNQILGLMYNKTSYLQQVTVILVTMMPNLNPKMEMKAVVMCVFHTLKHMPLEEDPVLSPYSFQAKWNKMISLALNMLSWTKVHLSSHQLTKEHLHLANLWKLDKGALRLFDSHLQLAEETFCKILSDCWGERDNESEIIEENHEIPPDSEEEGDLTGLRTIWSRRRPVRPPRHMEDFF